MDVNSIIENIKYGIASSNNGRVEVKDNSFLLNLLQDDLTAQDKSKSFVVSKPWRNCNKDRFPITGLILRMFLYIVEVVISIVYSFTRKLRCLLLGKSNDKDLSLSPRFNFILFVGTIIFYVVAIVYIFVFFGKSILLFNPDCYVNEQGAVTIPQPCGTEHYIYLLNAAECWANTGIKVLAGDEVKVSASGSFYSKISQMRKCAEDNRTLPYSRIIVSSKLDNDSDSLCMYKGKNAKFGSLLIQIKEDSEDPLYDSKDNNETVRIQQLTKDDDNGFDIIHVKSSGVLNFAVNDINITPSILHRMNDVKLQKKLETDVYRLEEKTFDFKQRDMWFSDNVGEILLSITVTRNTISEGESMPTCFVKLYRWIESKVLPLSKWKIVNSLFVYILIVFLWLFIDYKVGYKIVTFTKNLLVVFLKKIGMILKRVLLRFQNIKNKILQIYNLLKEVLL